MTIAVLLGCAAVTAVLDQLTKGVVTRRCAYDQLHALAGGAGVRRSANARPGVLALSLRQATLAWVAVVAWLVLVLALAGSLGGTGAAVGLGLAAGGATSNLADRIARGAVVDFIVIGWWPTFNVADAALVAGAIVVAGSVV